MKPVHTKIAIDEFSVGNTYAVSMRGKELYNAEVVKFHGGCWATVKVVEPANLEMASIYESGSTFDIKVAEYDVTEIVK